MNVDAYHTLLSRSVLMIAPSLPPGQASLGKLWECLVATLTLRLAFTTAATAVSSSPSVPGKVALAARQMVRSVKEPYTLVTLQPAGLAVDTDHRLRWRAGAGEAQEEDEEESRNHTATFHYSCWSLSMC